MSDITYVLEKDVGLISFYQSRPDPDLVKDLLELCCLQAKECDIRFYVIPCSTVIGKILLFYKAFCQEKGKELRILCANQGVLSYIKMLRIDQLIKVGLME
ncbi:MAG TPA: hypothetical protein PKL13_04895 [bacterium]|nr:hypothetical protein [bacterium]